MAEQTFINGQWVDAGQAEAAQDSLRPIRQFVSMAGDLFGAFDQSYASSDALVYNVPRNYQTVGPYGTSIEGTVISTANGGALVVSPLLVWLGIGFAAAMLWKR